MARNDVVATQIMKLLQERKSQSFQELLAQLGISAQRLARIISTLAEQRWIVARSEKGSTYYSLETVGPGKKPKAKTRRNGLSPEVMAEFEEVAGYLGLSPDTLAQMLLSQIKQEAFDTLRAKFSK